MVAELWVEKHRPSKVDEYVFRDQRLKTQVQNWIKEKTIPHLCMTGPAGTGKSSLAKVLLNEIGVDPGDILYVNASDNTGIDNVRDKIQVFASTIPNGEFKVILLEEADYLSPNAQGGLRRVLEDNADCCRFIFTGNLGHKIIPAIKSRCQEIVLKDLDLESFKLRMAEILVAEDVEISDEDILDTYIKATYPDLRKCINLMQMNTQNNVLLSPAANDSSTADWQIKAIDLIKRGDISSARKLIVEQIRSEEFEDFYRLCYRNLDWWGKTEEQQEQAILTIREGLVKHTSCADPEINLSATLIQLAKIAK